MSKVFRGKLIQGIKKAYYKNQLYLTDDMKSDKLFENFIDYITNRKWVIYRSEGKLVTQCHKAN